MPLDRAFWHPSHTSPQEVKPVAQLARRTSADLATWIVKLRFSQTATSEAEGTGFYINARDATCDIILTAAHNLIGTDGETSRNLTILASDGSKTLVKQQDVLISESYARRPHDTNADNDWGVIFCGHDSRRRHSGFGVNAILDDVVALEELLRHTSISVNGYAANSELGSPSHSSNAGGKCYGMKLLKYTAPTDRGMSGSPVWVACDGFETAIGIHAYAPENGRKENRGVRLTTKILTEVYKRSNLGYLDKSLKVKDYSDSRGLYLRFAEYCEHARVRLGRTGLATAFDILPVVMTPGTQRAKFAFRFRTPASWGSKHGSQWVCWDATLNKVTLMQKLHPMCFVELIRSGTGDKAKLRLIVAQSPRAALMLGDTRIRVDDADLGFAVESSEVCFVSEATRPHKNTFLALEDAVPDSE
ncbi:hypothetical protein BJX65DRAFT_279991 [Aspergillus insuetus]